jgi:hypothetical protein
MVLFEARPANSQTGPTVNNESDEDETTTVEPQTEV